MCCGLYVVLCVALCCVICCACWCLWCVMCCALWCVVWRLVCCISYDARACYIFDVVCHDYEAHCWDFSTSHLFMLYVSRCSTCGARFMLVAECCDETTFPTRCLLRVVMTLCWNLTMLVAAAFWPSSPGRPSGQPLMIKQPMKRSISVAC